MDKDKNNASDVLNNKNKEVTDCFKWILDIFKDKQMLESRNIKLESQYKYPSNRINNMK